MRLFAPAAFAPAAFAIACLAATVAAGQPVWNLTANGVPLRYGPGEGHAVIDQIAPGQRVDVGDCTATRRWCLVSTDRQVGWVDTAILPVPVAPRPVAPAVPATIRRVPEITVTPIPGYGTRPLPQAILDAVPGGRVEPPKGAEPGTRMPALLSVTQPTFNVTDGLINMRIGPGTDFAAIGQLRPGEGGIIDSCSASEEWCLITPDAGTAPGWVRMLFMGLQRL